MARVRKRNASLIVSIFDCQTTRLNRTRLSDVAQPSQIVCLEAEVATGLKAADVSFTAPQASPAYTYTHLDVLISQPTTQKERKVPESA